VRIGTASIAILLAACGASTPAHPTIPIARSAPERVSHDRRVADGVPFYLAPADASSLVIDLLPPRSGTSHLYVVAGYSAADYRAGDNMHKAFSLLEAQVALLTEDAIPTRGHPLPAPRRPSAPAAIADPPHGASAPPPTRSFKIFEPSSRSYVAASGRRAHVGSTYAFYEDAQNTLNFTQDEYARIDATLDEWWPRLRSIFGDVTDVDGDGHIAVFISSTAARVRARAGQSFVDGCDLEGNVPTCGPPGEVIYFWSLDGFPDADKNRDDYVRRFFPRNILHETVHLTQMRSAIDAGAPLRRIVVPEFYREGQASIVSLLTGLGDTEDWSRAREPLLRNGPEDNPFAHPYTLGVQFFYWMHQSFGAWIHRPIMTEMHNIAAFDPLEKAIGIPEPLALAEMAASLDFDGTPYGTQTHLEYPGAHVAERLGGRPHAVELAICESKAMELRYTGHAAIAIKHEVPVRVTFRTAGTRPYVLVAQP
jgi:hypothetical protein